LLIILLVSSGDALVIHADVTYDWRIKPSEQLHKRGLATAVTADYKDEFSGARR
jgi:hypothetical protein